MNKAKAEPDTETIHLIVDACVAIENLLHPDLADKRCDPVAVNARLLAWIDEFVMRPRLIAAGLLDNSGIQPISTAPKNQRVLVFGKHTDGRDEYAIGWLDIIDDRWYYAPQGGRINWTPTHWKYVPVQRPQDDERPE